MRALHGHVSDEPVHPVPNCSVLELHFRDDRLAAPAHRNRDARADPIG